MPHFTDLQYEELIFDEIPRRQIDLSGVPLDHYVSLSPDLTVVAHGENEQVVISKTANILGASYPVRVRALTLPLVTSVWGRRATPAILPISPLDAET